MKRTVARSETLPEIPAPFPTMTTDRRAFLQRCFATSCGFSATLLFAPVLARRSYGQEVFGTAIGQRDFGRIEKLADGVWALVSTPFTAQGKAGDTSTHSNGGLIVGKDHILAIDSYRTAEGARFMAEACQFLTGRLPTHVVNTHFHFDHLGGTRGFLQQGSSLEILMTQTTRNLAFETYLKASSQKDRPAVRVPALENWGGNLTDASLVLPEDLPYTLDLGGKKVTITPLSGHTDSDLIVTDENTQVTFGGDLIWDGIFPNFMSSSPSGWSTSVASVLGISSRIIVPGHGAVRMSDSPQMKQYQTLLYEIETHARAAHEKGQPSAAAAKEFALPESVGDFTYFREGFHELAMDAWYRELK